MNTLEVAKVVPETKLDEIHHQVNQAIDLSQTIRGSITGFLDRTRGEGAASIDGRAECPTPTRVGAIGAIEDRLDSLKDEMQDIQELASRLAGIG